MDDSDLTLATTIHALSFLFSKAGDGMYSIIFSDDMFPSATASRAP
jgi:hypothetical protein